MSANANIAALLYLVAGVLFILALKGLSSPATSRAGNRNGMIGMTIAVLTTLWISGVSDLLTWALVIGGMGIGGGMGAVMAQAHRHDRHAPAGGRLPQPGRHGRRAGRRRGAVFAGSLRHRRRRRHPCPEPDRTERWASPSAPSPSPARSSPSPSSTATCAARPIMLPARHLLNIVIALAIVGLVVLCSRMAQRALDLLGDRRLSLRDRHHPDHPDRRRRHAGRRLDAELLFGLGGGGAGLHPGKQRADHHRRAGRLLGRHPDLHHVQGHEPQLHHRHPRAASAATTGGAERRRRKRARSSRARPTMPPSS